MKSEKQKIERIRVSIAKRYKERLTSLEDENRLLRQNLLNKDAEIKMLKSSIAKYEQEAICRSKHFSELDSIMSVIDYAGVFK